MGVFLTSQLDGGE